MPHASQILRARGRPIPKIAVKPISVCLCGGILMPAIRAICVLFKPVQSTLTLLVAWIRTDHAHNAFASDDFTVAANFFDRSRNSHFTLLKLISFHTLIGMKHDFLLGSLERCFETCLFQQRFVLLAHHVVLHLGHEVHGDHHNNQQRSTTEVEGHVVFQDQELR